jgi:hypothetical protein
MFDRLFRFSPPAPATPECLQVGATLIPLVFVPHPRARRYLLRLLPDGSARVTIPRRGSVAAARDFAARNTHWLEQQLQRQAAQPKTSPGWAVGIEIFFRGELVRVEATAAALVRIGTELVKVTEGSTDLRLAIQKHLWRLAAKEFPPRVMALAAVHGITATRVSVRNQKSRWGSCSRRGTISLNWRLIQCPAFVADYIILHELAHQRQMNHSEKFWAEVALLCPEYRTAEAWLKLHAALLR